MRIITLDTKSKTGLIDLTEKVRVIVAESGVESGAVVLQSLHTTAGLTINENADPSVAGDILLGMGRIVADDLPYRHAEGNSPAHIKTSLIGPSLHVIISGGNLVLGTWQGIFFCEFDGPRSGRKVAVEVIPA